MSMNNGANARNLRSSGVPKQDNPRRPELRVVEGAKGYSRRAAVPFIIAALTLLAVAILVPLIANTNMAQLSYDIRDKRIEISEQQDQIETLQAQILEESSATSLREKASKIGMVPAGTVGVISVENGSIEGGSAAE